VEVMPKILLLMRSGKIVKEKVLKAIYETVPTKLNAKRNLDLVYECAIVCKNR
jgi:hypothetical protein